MDRRLIKAMFAKNKLDRLTMTVQLEDDIDILTNAGTFDIEDYLFIDDCGELQIDYIRLHGDAEDVYMCEFERFADRNLYE